jgi:hypothetical protein
MIESMLNLFSKYEIDWTAAAAIATFMAVLVALCPIWEERRRRRLIAINLRGRAYIKLQLLKPGVKMMFDPSLPPPRKNEFTDEELNAIQLLESIIANPFGLDPHEQDLLLVTVAQLGMLSAFTQSSARADKVPGQAEFTFNLMETTIKLLQSKQYRPIESSTTKNT